MLDLRLNDNRLTGVVDLTQLPGGMEHLRLGENSVSVERRSICFSVFFHQCAW